MTRRPSSSFLDYLLIAINPALIMALVGSLVFFLLTVFYRGDFEDRLWFTFAMFVMATVCIARISIEEGRGRAVLFALPLALLTAFAVNQFTNLSLYFNLALLALVWWSSDRLTWDCTVIDDEKDSTGAGLLQVLGWEGDVPADEDAKNEAAPVSRFLEQWFPTRGGGHTPGVWVIYFSLAALPLFGAGQWFMPAEDARARSTAFLLLMVYVGSGLALLMTTTFLGLRRYLRQRGVEMPLEMAATWLSVGAAMIGILLLLSMLLPRPTGRWELPTFVASNMRDSSWFGRGKEAAQGDQSGPQSGESKNGEPSGAQGDESQAQGETSENSSATPGKNGTAKNASAQSKSAAQSSAQGQAANASNNASAAGSESGDNSASGKAESDEQTDSKSQSSPKKSDEGSKESSSEKNSQQETPGDQPSSEAQAPHKGSESSATQPPAEPPPPEPPPPAPQSASDGTSLFGKLAELLATLGRLLSYVLLAAILLFFAWKYREPLLATLRQLWQEWLDFLEKLLGKKKTLEPPVTAALPPSPTFPAFASFADPFHSGMAQRSSPADLVEYSFRAFEAWSRERGCPRNSEQTPLEFAQVVGTQEAFIHREARELADLYCQLAYARTAMPSDSLQKLSRLWRGMTAAAPSRN